MNKYFCLISLIWLICHGPSAYGAELRPGDILLQPMKCWSCQLIEAEEDSEFAHIGIVYSSENHRVLVAEAYGKVQIIPLEQFLRKTDPKRKVVVKRFREYEFSQNEIIRFQEKIKSWEGNPYDRMFLLHNSINGKEALYCSELVYKGLLAVLNFKDLKTSVMLFENNPEYWDKYFRGNTPRGELGISPEDFNQSSDFEFIKEL